MNGENDFIVNNIRLHRPDTIKLYLEVSPFERQLNEEPNGLHVYKKTAYYPSWHYDFREFHKKIRPEVLAILEKESKFF